MKRFISLLCAAVLLFTLTGCGAKEQPDAVVSVFCDAMKAFDLDAMSACLVSTAPEELLDDTAEGDFSDAVYDILKEHAGEITYTIGEVSTEEETGTVAVTFTHPDVSAAVTAAVGEYFGQALSLAFSGADDETIDALLETLLIEKLQSVDAASKESTVEFSCVMTDDGWKINGPGDAVINVLMSNMIDAFTVLSDDLDEGEDAPAEDDGVVWRDVPLGQEVELSSLRLKVTGCTEETVLKSEWDESAAKEGTKFVVFTVELENLSKAPLIADADDFSFYDRQDRNYAPTFDVPAGLENVLFSRELAPNMPETGVIIYNVPADCEGYYFTVREDGTDNAYRCFGQ